MEPIKLPQQAIDQVALNNPERREIMRSIRAVSHLFEMNPNGIALRPDSIEPDDPQPDLPGRTGNDTAFSDQPIICVAE